jgi:hypothetical protein
MIVFETATRTLPESIANLDLDYLGRKLLDDDAVEAERRNGERLWDEERVERALKVDRGARGAQPRLVAVPDMAAHVKPARDADGQGAKAE